LRFSDSPLLDFFSPRIDFAHSAQKVTILVTRISKNFNANTLAFCLSSDIDFEGMGIFHLPKNENRAKRQWNDGFAKSSPAKAGLGAQSRS
jgi:hypothetical protein